jgi:hypothetical protein
MGIVGGKTQSDFFHGPKLNTIPDLPWILDGNSAQMSQE